MDVEVDRSHRAMISLMQASLLVLAGGGSRRMGRAKAWLEVGDTFLLRYVVDRLAPAFSEVMVSFAEPEQLEEPLPYRIVFDRKHSAGPLAGLEAGLLAARNEVVFAVACDMPYVTQDVAQLAAPMRPSPGSTAGPSRFAERTDDPRCRRSPRRSTPAGSRPLMPSLTSTSRGSRASTQIYSGASTRLRTWSDSMPNLRRSDN